MAPTTEASAGHSPSLSLVLPTYNEATNLPRLVPRLAQALDRAGLEFEVIVVDDDSPDGTWRVAGDLAAEDPRLRVIRRRGQRGLATAVVAGWAAARGDVLGVMDADLQYPPEGLLDLVSAIVADRADVAVASRYAPGARTGSWAFRREVISRAAIRVAKLALPAALGQVADPNSGCFLLRRRVIDSVPLRPVGFKILIEVLARGHWQRVVEVPYAYAGRGSGKSKLGLRQTAEFLEHLAHLVWDTRVMPGWSPDAHPRPTEPR
jgi:dolichol-phosphate mannosyltransferase